MKKKVCILSIDGCGIRGIIPAVILSQIQKRLTALTGSPAHIIDYFDMVAGSSTGGLLACGLLAPGEEPGQPKYSPEELLDLYEDQGDDIYAYDSLTKGIAKISSIMFGPAYDDDNLEDILHSYFGELKLSQSLKPSLITAYDIEKRQAKFFTSLDAKRSDSHDFYLRDIARATSAAPSYFTPAEIKSISGGRYALIDGAVFANNPTLCAVSEARKTDFTQALNNAEKPSRPKPEQLFVLSLGTGNPRQPYKFEEAKNFKSQNWTKPLLDMVMSANAETVAYQAGKLFEKKTNKTKGVVAPANYVRIDINLSNENVSPDMADASEDNINQLKDIAYRLADDESELLDMIAAQLIENK